MARTWKWILGGAVALVLVLAGVALALQVWVRSDDFRVRIEREGTAALGVPLKLGRISVDVWPLPAVAVDQVVIATKPPLTLERVEARPIWSGLFAGRLEVSTLIVRNAVLPQTSIDALGATMQRRAKAAPGKAASGGNSIAFPRRALLERIVWIDEKGQRLGVNAEVELGGDGLLDEASFKVVEGRFQGAHGKIERRGDDWPVRIDIGGGKVAGKIKLQPQSNGAHLLTGQLATDGVEVAALTAPSRTLTGKLQAQTQLRGEFRQAAQLADALTTQTRFTVRDAVINGLDLVKAVETVGLSRGGITRLDTLAGQVNTQGKVVHLTNLVATSGALAANGDVTKAANGGLSGRITVDLNTRKGNVGIPLAVSGTVDSPSVMLTRSALIGAAIGTVIAPGVGTGAGATQGEKLGDKLRGLFGR